MTIQEHLENKGVEPSRIGYYARKVGLLSNDSSVEYEKRLAYKRMSALSILVWWLRSGETLPDKVLPSTITSISVSLNRLVSNSISAKWLARGNKSQKAQYNGAQLVDRSADSVYQQIKTEMENSKTLKRVNNEIRKYGDIQFAI